MDIITNISNHPVHTSFNRKAFLSDLTLNARHGRILFKIEVKTLVENKELVDLSKFAQFIADSESTIQEGISDYDFIMGRILNHEDILTIISDCVTFLDQSGKLNQRLGLV